MAADSDVKEINLEEGQSLFEFMIFLPFLVAMLSFLVTVIGSINGAINQQKSARGYFFFVVKGNSTLPLSPTVSSLLGAGVTSVGVYSIGWADRFEGGRSPVAPCYELNSVVAGGLKETCDEKPDSSVQVSKFIRPVTAFGVCGNAYILKDDKFVYNYDGTRIDYTCEISQ